VGVGWGGSGYGCFQSPCPHQNIGFQVWSPPGSTTLGLRVLARIHGIPFVEDPGPSILSYVEYVTATHQLLSAGTLKIIWFQLRVWCQCCRASARYISNSSTLGVTCSFGCYGDCPVSKKVERLIRIGCREYLLAMSRDTTVRFLNQIFIRVKAAPFPSAIDLDHYSKLLQMFPLGTGSVRSSR